MIGKESVHDSVTRRGFIQELSAAIIGSRLPIGRYMAETTLKMAQTESLNIGYEQTGHDTGEAIILLHGWPYDPRCYDGIRGPLADAGYRVIVPYLRGFGPTVIGPPRSFVPDSSQR